MPPSRPHSACSEQLLESSPPHCLLYTAATHEPRSSVQYDGHDPVPASPGMRITLVILKVDSYSFSPSRLSRPTPHTVAYDSSFFPDAIKLWNKQPVEISSAFSLFMQKSCLKLPTLFNINTKLLHTYYVNTKLFFGWYPACISCWYCKVVIKNVLTSSLTTIWWVRQVTLINLSITMNSIE